MKILYFTTALQENDFQKFLEIWDSPLNTTNQVFHNRMIRALGIENNVEVISIRPFSRKHCSLKKLNYSENIQNNISWRYLEIKRTKSLRLPFIYKQSKSIAKRIERKNTVIITDTLNPNVLICATKIARNLHIPIIGICSETPSNIMGTSKSYTKLLLKIAQDLSGYISLTQNINDLFNVKNKPYLIIEGLVENKIEETNKNQYGQYIYFDGNLNEKYGLYNLIDAFKDLEIDGLNLLVSGHHIDKAKFDQASSHSTSIYYLGSLHSNEVHSIEQNALICINPQPYTEDLQRFQIPSNTIDFIASGTPTISVRNKNLQAKLNDSAFWIKNNNVDTIKQAILDIVNMNETERESFGNKAKEDAMNIYSLEKVSLILNIFLKRHV